MKSASATKYRCGCSVFCTEAGEALEGGENGSIDVMWTKGGATDVYSVTPVYDVFGVVSEGTPVQVSVANVPLGMVIILH